MASQPQQQQQGIEEVRQAILALYGAADAGSRQAANAFLLAFAERPEAWAVALGLLEAAVASTSSSSPSPPEVLYFAANVLHTKVSRDWSQLLLSLQQQQQQALAAGEAAALLSTRLLAFLRGYLGQQPEQQQSLPQGARLVVSRVGLALTAVALRDSDPGRGVSRLLGEAFALLGGDPTGVRAAPGPAVVAGLGIIQSLPEEAARADMGKAKRDAVEGALGVAAPQILAVAEALLAERPELGALALQALDPWLGLPLAQEGAGAGAAADSQPPRTLSLSVLAERCPGLLERLAGVVGLAHPWAQQHQQQHHHQQQQGAAFADLLCAAARLVGRLAAIPEVPAYPPPPARAPAALLLLEALLAGLPGAVLADPSPFGEAAAHALAAGFIELAVEECEGLLAGSAAHGPPVAEAALALTAQRASTHVATLALDFWAALAEVPLEERTPALGPPLYARLTGVLAERLAYPPGFVSWEDGEAAELEAEEFVTGYREGELMREMLEGCCSVLRGHGYARQLVEGGVAPLLLADAQGQGQGQGDWRRAEVALLMLQQASRPLLSEARREQQGQQQVQQGHQQQQQQQQQQGTTAWLLLQTLHQALASPGFQARHPLLLRALLRFLAAFHPLLLPPPPPATTVKRALLRTKAAGSDAPIDTGLDEEGARALHRLALQCVVLRGLAAPGIEPPLGGSGGGGGGGDGEQEHQRPPGAAALAFRAVCVGALPSGVIARDPESLQLCLGALEAASASGLPLPDRLLVAGAAVRTLLAVPCPGGAVAALHPLLAGLTTPILQRLAAALGQIEQPQQQGGAIIIPLPQLLLAVAENLQLMGEVVRFLDQAPTLAAPPTAAGQPPPQQEQGPQQGQQRQEGHLALSLVEALWPLLARVAAVAEAGGARGGRADDPYRAVLTQLFQLQRHLLVGLGPLVAPRLPDLLAMAVRLFAPTLHEGALETGGVAVEMFHREAAAAGGGAADGPFAALLGATAGPTFAHLRRGDVKGPQECPQLVAAFFGMLVRFLQFRPGVLYASPELPTALDLALACLEEGAAELQATRAVLLFLRDLVKKAQDAAAVTAVPAEQAALAAALLPLLEARAPALVRLSLAALAGRTLSTLWGQHLEFAFAFLQAWPILAAARPSTSSASNPGLGGGISSTDAAVARLGEWVRAAVGDPAVLAPEAFGAGDRELLVGLTGGGGVGPESSKQRFKLLMDDVRRVAGGECEAEALRSHLLVS